MLVIEAAFLQRSAPRSVPRAPATHELPEQTTVTIPVSRLAATRGSIGRMLPLSMQVILSESACEAVVRSEDVHYSDFRSFAS